MIIYFVQSAQSSFWISTKIGCVNLVSGSFRDYADARATKDRRTKPCNWSSCKSQRFLKREFLRACSKVARTDEKRCGQLAETVNSLSKPTRVPERHCKKDRRSVKVRNTSSEYTILIYMRRRHAINCAELRYGSTEITDTEDNAHDPNEFSVRQRSRRLDSLRTIGFVMNKKWQQCARIARTYKSGLPLQVGSVGLVTRSRNWTCDVEAEVNEPRHFRTDIVHVECPCARPGVLGHCPSPTLACGQRPMRVEW